VSLLLEHHEALLVWKSQRVHQFVWVILPWFFELAS